MAKESQATEAKSDSRSQVVVEPATASELDYGLAALSKLPAGLIGGSNGSFQAQTALLGDPRLRTVQRQALAAQTGQVQGNHYLQRLMASLRCETRTTNPTPGWAAQRSQTPGVSSTRSAAPSEPLLQISPVRGDPAIQRDLATAERELSTRPLNRPALYAAIQSLTREEAEALFDATQEGGALHSEYQELHTTVRNRISELLEGRRGAQAGAVITAVEQAAAEAPGRVEEEAEAPPLTYDTAQTVLSAVMEILDGFGGAEVWQEVAPGRYRLISHPAAHGEVPAPYRDALWDFFKATHGIEHRGGEWVEAPGQRRLYWIQLGMRRIRPLLELALREMPDSASVIEEGILQPAEAIRTRAHEEAASRTLTEAAEEAIALRDPEQASRQTATWATLREAIRLSDRVQTMANAMPSGRAWDAFDELLERNPPPGVLGERLRGARGRVAMGTIGDIFAALNAIASLRENATGQQQLFNERLGSFAYVRGTADLLANVGNILQGIVSVLCLFTSAVSSAAGYADEAARVLAAARRTSGGLGRVIGVLNIIRGSIDLLHPGSTRGERGTAISDIGLGVGAVVGGTAGAPIVAGALALRANLELIRFGAMTVSAIIQTALRTCYERMARDGREIVIYANQLLAGPALIESERDSERRAALQRMLSTVEWNLRAVMNQLLEDASRRRGGHSPGVFDALRRRFARCQPPPIESTSRNDLIAQAREVVAVIEAAFDDADQVMREVTQQGLDESAFGGFFEAGDILPSGAGQPTVRGQEPFSRLVESLESDDYRVRVQAMHSMARLARRDRVRSEAVIEQLRSRLDDPNQAVRETARRLLEQLVERESGE